MHEIVEGLPGTEVMFDDFLIIGMLSRAYLEGKPSVCALQLQVVEPTDQLSVSPERLPQLVTQSCKVFVRLLSMVGLTSYLC